MKKVNYLANKAILIEINKSKMTYCWSHDASYNIPDYIIDDPLLMADPDTILLAKESMIHVRTLAGYYELLKIWEATPRKRPCDKPVKKDIHVDDIPTNTIIWRIMTSEHIPLDDKNQTSRTNNMKGKEVCNFPPFIHVIDGREVVRSHWKDGAFSATHGRLNSELGKMFVLLVDKIGRLGKFNRYTYLADMKGHAILNLCHRGLMFNEFKSDNPFAYYTTAIMNSFRQILNSEKKSRDIRDDLLEEAGAMPSMTRQMR